MKPVAGRQRLNPFSRMQPHPAPLARIVRQALGRRPVSGDIPVKPVNHDKDRARFRCAAPTNVGFVLASATPVNSDTITGNF